MTRSIGHIMLIDDEDDCMFVSKLVLKKAGYIGKLTCSTGGAEALELLRNGEMPDLLLVDINMPGMTGFQMIETCEREHLLPNGHTSVVMFSSSNRQEDIETAHRYDSVMTYVEKALTVEQFDRIAALHLRRA